MMRKALVVLALLFLVTVVCPAQEPKAPEELPTIDQIVDRQIEAAGGKAVLEKLNTRISKGTFELPAMGASGTWERYEKAPNKSFTIVEIPGFGTILQCFDGTVAWEQNPMVGFVEKSGPQLEVAKLDSAFHRELKMKELYPKMTVKGKEKVGEREAWLVEATPANAPMERLYFDVKTGLLIRQGAEREGPQGLAQMEFTLDDYREIEGYMLPHAIRQSAPGFELTLTVTEVKVNAEIDDARFAKPAAK